MKFSKKKKNVLNNNMLIKPLYCIYLNIHNSYALAFTCMPVNTIENYTSQCLIVFDLWKYKLLDDKNGHYNELKSLSSDIFNQVL